MTSATGRTGIPRELIAAIRVEKSAWEICVFTEGVPGITSCRVMTYQEPSLTQRSSAWPTAVMTDTVVPADETALWDRIRYGIGGGKVSYVSATMERPFEKYCEQIWSIGTPSVVEENFPSG